MLKEKLEHKTKIFSPDLPADPIKVIAAVGDIITDNVSDLIAPDGWPYPSWDRLIFVGSSLGGFYARYLATKWDGICIAVNPAVSPAASLEPYIDTVQGYYDNRFSWKKEYCDTLKEMEKHLTTEELGWHNHLFVTKDDDICPPAEILKAIQRHKWCQIFEDGGHRQLDHFPEVVDYIDNAFFSDTPHSVHEPY